MQFVKFFLAAAFALGASAHMEMQSPAPFRSKYNTNSNPGTIDYSMTSPLTGAAQFPCKGYTSDFSDLTGVGKPTATWAQGSSQSITITGGASHNGGSCQLSMSYDSGKTFQVVHSFVGSCPLSSTYDFTVPSDAPTGNAIFAWIWYNHTGNREIYMNCASVAITAGSGARTAAAVAFSSRPNIFQANIGNGCTTVEGADVVYPNPGPDVTPNTTNPSGTTGFTGTCDVAVAGGGSSGASAAVGGTTSAAAAAGASPVATSSSSAVVSIPVVPTSSITTSASKPANTPTASVPGGIFVTVPSSSASATKTTTTKPSGTGSSTSPSGTGTVNPNFTVSNDGTCGGTVRCPSGYCCSGEGFCGSGDAWCGANSGCQVAYGQCGVGSARIRVRRVGGWGA